MSLLISACGGDSAGPAAGIQGVNFVGITVADLEQGTAFYTPAMALDVVGEWEPGTLAPITELADGAPLRARMLRSANAQILLMQFEDIDPLAPVPVNGPGIAHVCYQAIKDTRAYETFLEQGARPLGSEAMVQLSERNPVEYAYALDLDGIMFEVEHVDVSQLDLDKPPANEYRIRQVALATPNLAEQIRFYGALLGESEVRRMGRWLKLSGDKIDAVSGLPGSQLEMAWYQTRNLELEFIQFHSHPAKTPSAPRPVNARGYSMIVFDVADLDSARASLLAAGGTVASDVAPMNGGEIFFGRDPDGNLLGFQAAPSDAVVSSQNFDGNGL
ncbi:MAG: VOC family protein [Pseudomonadota bacterium]